jgi:NADH-quinone oxidoreductase subunit M
MSGQLLTVLVFCPLIGAALAAALGLTGKGRLVKPVSVFYSLVPLILSVRLWVDYSTGGVRAWPGLSTAEINTPWIPILGSRFHMGCDAISVLLVVLTALLTTVSLIYAQRLSSSRPDDRLWQYYALFFALEVGMLGVFVSLDLVLFFLFWEISLIPMYFIILLWGGPRREGAALKFILYTLVGSAGMLVAFAAIFLKAHTTDMVALIEMARSGPIVVGALGAWVFWLLWIAFAIKVPVFPFHTWLPLAHVEAPTEGSVILAAILLKMGVYGMIRVCLQMLPQEFHYFSATVAWLGAISVVYGAFCALAQTDLKRLVAYSSINHMGFCTLAVAAAAAVTGAQVARNPAFEGFRVEALSGAVVEMLAHGLITGAMFLLVGVIYDRAHHRDLRRFGGLWTSMPVYGGVMIFCVLASLGLPLLMGFVGEFLALNGSYPIFQGAVIFSIFGLILAACYWLWMVQRLLYGPVNETNAGLPDINNRELLSIAPLMALALLLGLFPRLILDMINVACVTIFPTRPF